MSNSKEIGSTPEPNRTSVEAEFGVRFPGGQEFFGIINLGKFEPEQVSHEHKTESYTYPEGSYPEGADPKIIWSQQVEEAKQKGTQLTDDGNPKFLSLQSVKVEDGKLTLTSKGITYKDYKISTDPRMRELIDAGDIEPTNMLAQCQVIRGNYNSEPVIVATWRDPNKNEYKGDEMHLIGGHHDHSKEADIWQTYINEQKGEGRVPEEEIQNMEVTGIGWNRELQKPELLGVVTMNPDFDLKPVIGQGRGIKTFAIPDKPRAIQGLIMDTFPQAVPVGVAGLYSHLSLNHGEFGKEVASDIVSWMKDITNEWQELSDEDFFKKALQEIPGKTNALRIRAELPLFEDLPQSEQERLIALHLPSYYAAFGREMTPVG